MCWLGSESAEASSRAAVLPIAVRETARGAGMPERQVDSSLRASAPASLAHDAVGGARRTSRLPAFGPTLVAAWRAQIALRHVAREARKAWRWWRDSREVTNFTYELTPRNMEQLAAFLAHA